MGRGRSLGELLVALERRGDTQDRAPGPPEPVRCPLPPGHSCLGGWHLRLDGGAGTAYGRCPRWRAKRAEAAARVVPGGQTFATFERFREPEAYGAARAWVEACRAGLGKLALLRPETLESNTGCGKTHLLRAADRELAGSGRWVELVTAPDLTTVVRGRALFDPAERSAAEIQAKRWSRADVLVLDDLGQEETSGPVTAGFLVGLLDQREDRSLGWSSNLGEAGLRSRYGPPLVSRLLGGALVPGLRGRDYRQSFA
jgi:hypothetical protein